jgi:hypothetical protein
VHAAGQTWAGSDCATLLPYEVGADEYPALSVTLPEQPTVWMLRLRFAGPHLMALSHGRSGAMESVQVTICPNCNFDSPLCQSADLARRDLGVLWEGDTFLRFETILAVTPNRVDIVGR